MTGPLHVDALVAEIGSTTTLVNAFAGLNVLPRFLGQGRAETTADKGDVRIGLHRAIEDLKATLQVGELQYDELFATSSAAGGLRMSVHGLVYDMTVRAARAAALGAGAVVKAVTAGKMRDSQLQALKALRPNLILLAGGTDYGESETALHNAEKIALLALADIPVIYAGNAQVQDEVGAIFRDKGISVSLCENVYPRLDQLNIEPARRIIQKLFETHIVKAPGMAHVYDMVTQPLMPTPGAVMEAARLLHGEIGNLLVVDVGGATTDVHSACEESQEVARVQTRREPYFMRTVEGDLGVYVNAPHLLELIGEQAVERELGISLPDVLAGYGPIPESPVQYALAARLAKEAGLRAVQRHAGQMRQVFLPGGRQQIAEGKDLSLCTSLLATGGALTRLPGRQEALLAIRDMNRSGKWLYPKPGAMRILVDRHYIMASLGALSRRHPQAALRLMMQSFEEDVPCTR